MIATDTLRNYFKAALTITALSSPSPEECEAIESIAKVGVSIQAETYVFDTVSFFRKVMIDPDAGISFEQPKWEFASVNDPIADAFEFIRSYEGRAVFIMCDIQGYMDQSDSSRFDLSLVRRIKTLALELKQSAKRVVLLGKTISIPDDLVGIVMELVSSLPSAKEIEASILQTISDLRSSYASKIIVDLSPDSMTRLVRASQGLTLTEIGDILRLSVVSFGVIGADTIKAMNQSKMAKLSKLNVEFSEPPTVAVGGLDLLKNWLATRTKRFQQYDDRTRPAPKGMMLVGLPGTGKSMIAKAIGQQWSIPILSVDFGAIYSSLVGDSESRLRHLLEVSEAIAPCVLLIDEVDKVMGGMKNANDSGVSQRLLGKLLTWMQEKKSPVFVCCTANNISGLPPEFTRKGRFDEIFFVDLPNREARREIIQAHATKYAGIHFNCTDDGMTRLVDMTTDFSGAELAAAIDDAIGIADDSDVDEISYDDLAYTFSETKPLAHRNSDLINSLRTWASSSARSACSKDSEIAIKGGSRTVQMF